MNKYNYSNCHAMNKYNYSNQTNRGLFLAFRIETSGHGCNYWHQANRILFLTLIGHGVLAWHWFLFLFLPFLAMIVIKLITLIAFSITISGHDVLLWRGHFVSFYHFYVYNEI
jgi:hypothetical protein